MRGGSHPSIVNNFILASVLSKVSSKMRKAMIENMNNSQVESIGKILRSFLQSKVQLPPRLIKQLKRDRDYIEALTATGNRRVPVKLKRQVIRQRGGIFAAAIPAALKLLAPIVGPILGKIF